MLSSDPSALTNFSDVLDNPIERLAMYEAAVQQVYTLCQHDGVITGLSPEARAANAMVRARIFWYAHVHEGLTTGLRGGRLLMWVNPHPDLHSMLIARRDDDDLKTFQRELPPAPSINPRALQTTNITYSLALQYATAPIRLASACRKVHAALTGPKARAAKRLDGAKLEDTWEALALCWEEFESLRPIQRSDHVTNEDTTRFVDGWQVSSNLDCPNGASVVLKPIFRFSFSNVIMSFRRRYANVWKLHTPRSCQKSSRAPIHQRQWKGLFATLTNTWPLLSPSVSIYSTMWCTSFVGI